MHSSHSPSRMKKTWWITIISEETWRYLFQRIHTTTPDFRYVCLKKGCLWDRNFWVQLRLPSRALPLSIAGGAETACGWNAKILNHRACVSLSQDLDKSFAVGGEKQKKKSKWNAMVVWKLFILGVRKKVCDTPSSPLRKCYDGCLLAMEKSVFFRVGGKIVWFFKGGFRLHLPHPTFSASSISISFFLLLCFPNFFPILSVTFFSIHFT